MQTLFHALAKVDALRAVLAGICLGIGFIAPSLWWLSIYGLVWTINVVCTKRLSKRILVLVGLVWMIKSLCSIVWFWSAYPITWVEGLGSLPQIILISAYWLTSALWLASGGIFFTLIAIILRRRPSVPYLIWLILVPFLWLISELVATTVFSFFTAGPGSWVQTYFSFGMVGYLIGSTWFGVLVAKVGGVYGLSVLMVMLAVLVYEGFRRKSGWIALSCVAACLLVVSYALPTATAEIHTTNTVISVDTAFDPLYLSTDDGYSGKEDTLKKALSEALLLNPDVVVLPEDSRYLQSQFDDTKPIEALVYFRFIHKDTQSVVIDSGRYTTPEGQTVLRATVFDGVSKNVWQFDKQYLVPQGEYVPFIYGTVLRIIGFGAVVDAVARDSSYRPGPLLQSAFVPDYIPGVLFCFESVNPRGVNTLTQVRPLPFIAHPISHGWFHSSKILWQQLDVMLQIQARYSGVPIVSAGNMARGKLYLPNGRIETGTIVGTGERYILREFTF